VTDVDLDALPVLTLPAGSRLWRIHHESRPCWFFSRGPGRFDPLQSDHHGACYWGRSDLAAWVEKLRTRRVLDERDIEPLRLARIVLEREMRLADLTDRRALTAGLTAAIASAPESDYGPSQELASRLVGRVDGILYHCRHDMRQRLKTVAWLGPAGSHPSRRPKAQSKPLPAELRRRAEQQFGYTVLPHP
jgi:hypothetical protein